MGWFTYSKAMIYLRQPFKYTSKLDLFLARSHRHKTQPHTPVKVTAALLNSSSAGTTVYHRFSPYDFSYIENQLVPLLAHYM